jgi:hypothetical protein
VDTSASQEKVLKDEQEAAGAFVRSVLRPEKDTAAVLSFTGITRIEQPPTGDLARLRAAAESVKVEFKFGSPECDDDSPPEVRIRCETRAWDSLLVATRGVLSRTPQNTRRAIILLSDGDDCCSTVARSHAVEEAVRENTVVYSIGIRDEDLPQGKLQRDKLRQPRLLPQKPRAARRRLRTGRRRAARTVPYLLHADEPRQRRQLPPRRRRNRQPRPPQTETPSPLPTGLLRQKNSRQRVAGGRR